MPTADELFRAEVDRCGFGYSLTPEGLYEIKVRDNNLNISLENIRRNFERDGDSEAIIRFVDRLTIDLSVKDRAFLGRIGGVVIEQYRQSGYPITKDVLEVSDDGIAAIGTYPEPE